MSTEELADQAQVASHLIFLYTATAPTRCASPAWSSTPWMRIIGFSREPPR